MKETEMLRRLEKLNRLHQSLLCPAPLEEKLGRITDAVVEIFDADFCRVWVTRPGDRCESGCVHAEATEGPHVCRHRDCCLHLLSSSGRYTHVDGETHRRVPFGCYKIGRVASEEDGKFVTNDVTHDPRVHNHGWAAELGLVSFAGYPLRPPGGPAIGVLALFARHPISAEDDALLESLSAATAQVIESDRQQRRIEEAGLRLARREQELRRFRLAMDSSADQIFIIDRDAMRFVDVNDTACALLHYSREELLDLGPQEIGRAHV